MASRVKKRMALRRKFHILRTLTNSKSVNRSSIIMDAFLYIYNLKLKLEAMEREYLYLTEHVQEVKVERLGRGFLVRVTCKKDKDLLVSILVAFEEMKLNVVQAKQLSCNCFFGMEAIVEAAYDDHQAVEVRDVTQAVLNAIQKPAEQGTL
ncbi:unnamed protein product [Ilex paraguariensis]|uniref:Plant bHLH transcription factor ACT-like domain-containing protein n=1 Tax=Ilex paraguariensis TaxID=185542 RepID=A0ABC8RX14_9AQUA